MKSTSKSGNHSTVASQEADRRFDSLSSHVERMDLAHQATARNSKALKKQHPNLLMVTTGFRQRRDQDGTYVLHPEPCVLLTVREKWPLNAPGSINEQPLPKRLYVTKRRGGNVTRYGVPTDVQDVKWLSGVVPQGACQIVLDMPGDPTGTLTCAVDVITAGGAERFVLSALHVLSPMPDVDSEPRSGAKFSQSGGAGPIGASTAFGGSLCTNEASLDAQLATIDQDALAASFSNLPKGQIAFAKSKADVDAIAHTSAFVVVVPTNVARDSDSPRESVYTQFSGYADSSLQITYDVTHNGLTFPQDFYFNDLIVVAAGLGNPVTMPGDSGSPVIAKGRDGFLLVGMLIAGPTEESDTDRMVILPAWSIFDPNNWTNSPVGVKAFLPAF